MYYNVYQLFIYGFSIALQGKTEWLTLNILYSLVKACSYRHISLLVYQFTALDYPQIDKVTCPLRLLRPPPLHPYPSPYPPMLQQFVPSMTLDSASFKTFNIFWSWLQTNAISNAGLTELFAQHTPTSNAYAHTNNR